MKLALTVLLAIPLLGQGVRLVPSPSTTTASNIQGGLPQVLAVPNAIVSLCGYPASGIPCTNYAQTYTDATLSTACPASTPVVLDNTNICTASSDSRGNFGFWVANSANYAYTLSYGGKVHGPYWISSGGGDGGGGTLVEGVYWYNITAFGGIPNSPSACNDTALNDAVAAAVAAGGPGRILFPTGAWYMCAKHTLPTGIFLEGVGYWSQEPEFATVVNTVIKAGATFPTANDYTGFMFQLGNGSSDTYGSQINGINLDGSGVAYGDLFVASANERTGANYDSFINYRGYGMYDCGADNGVPSGCLGYTGPGAQGHGPFLNLEFQSDDSYGGTANSVALYVDNSGNPREYSNISIHPVSANPANKPTYAIVASGVEVAFRNIHTEGTLNGMFLSPSAAPWCVHHCNGGFAVRVEKFDATSVGTTNVIEIGGANATGFTFDNIFDNNNSTCLIKLDTTTECFHPTGSLSHAEMTGSGILEAYDLGLDLPQPTHMRKALTIESNDNPQLELQSLTGPFYGHTFYADVSGNMNIGSPGSSPGNWLFTKGFSFLSLIGNTNAGNGLNLQGLASAPVGGGDATMVQNAVTCSNAFWNTAVTVWNIGNIGGAGFACAWGHNNGGFGITTSNASQPGTMTNTNFLAATHFFVNNLGNVLIGPGALSTADGGFQLKVIGNIFATGNVTCGGSCGGGGMVYPGAGIANSTGSAWATSYGVSGTGSVCLTVNCSMTTPNLGTPSAINLTNATSPPTWNQSTSGNAATATALASTPTLCSAGNAPVGILANGNATGCAAIGGGSGFYQTFYLNSTPVTQRARFNTIDSAGGNHAVTATFSDNGTNTTSITYDVTSGPSGALDSSTNPYLDIIQTVVPTKSGSNVFTGLNKFNFLQMIPTSVDPGCTVTGNFGLTWMDNTSSVTTHLKVCAAVASTPAWVTVF